MVGPGQPVHHRGRRHRPRRRHPVDTQHRGNDDGGLSERECRVGTGSAAQAGGVPL